jgi:uncharacterized Zn-binding protein involved in type VI secretion
VTLYALIGDPCKAEGHPTACTEPANGTIENTNSDAPLTVDGVVVADHGDGMVFPSHGHAVDADGNCINYQSHTLVPDQTPPWTIDGRPLMRVGDDTTDPTSGGRAYISSTANDSFEVNP